MESLLRRAARKFTTVIQRYKSQHLLNAAFKSEFCGGGMTETR